MAWAVLRILLMSAVAAAAAEAPAPAPALADSEVPPAEDALHYKAVLELDGQSDCEYTCTQYDLAPVDGGGVGISLCRVTAGQLVKLGGPWKDRAERGGTYFGTKVAQESDCFIKDGAEALSVQYVYDCACASTHADGAEPLFWARGAVCPPSTVAAADPGVCAASPVRMGDGSTALGWVSNGTCIYPVDAGADGSSTSSSSGSRWQGLSAAGAAPNVSTLCVAVAAPNASDAQGGGGGACSLSVDDIPDLPRSFTVGSQGPGTQGLFQAHVEDKACCADGTFVAALNAYLFGTLSMMLSDACDVGTLLAISQMHCMGTWAQDMELKEAMLTPGAPCPSGYGAAYAQVPKACRTALAAAATRMGVGVFDNLFPTCGLSY